MMNQFAVVGLRQERGGGGTMPATRWVERGVLAGALLSMLAVAWSMAPAQTASPPSIPPGSAAGAAPAATPPAKVPEFAVASIKPDKSGSMGIRVMFGEDGFTATNIPLKFLLREAFDVNDDQIAGEPGWTDSERFDIDAKVDSSDVAAMKDLSFEQRRAMMLSLLADRFGLKYHEETKDLPVYALVVAKGGLKIHAAKPGDTYPNGLKGPDGKSGGAGMMMMNGNGQLTAQGVELGTLTRVLAERLGRTVIDKTGLSGNFDFTLQLPAMHGAMAMPRAKDGGAPGADDAAADDPEASIFTDVEEQLGLKLDSQKAPLPVYVIDHVDQPTEN
jgi:uncharacterized protein (TIGR03435 family)